MNSKLHNYTFEIFQNYQICDYTLLKYFNKSVIHNYTLQCLNVMLIINWLVALSGRKGGLKCLLLWTTDQFLNNNILIM